EEPVIVSAADHPPLDRKGRSPSTVIAFEHGCPHRKRLESWYEKRGEMPARIIELGSYHAMLGCVAAGMGIALLPRSVLATFPESMKLRLHRLPPGENKVETSLIWRKGAGSPKVEALRQLLGSAAQGKHASATFCAPSMGNSPTHNVKLR